MFIFDALRQIRQNTLKAAEHLSTEQLNHIPERCNNNIIWHIGHMMASQQILCYTRAGAKTRLSQEFIDKYKKGTSPKEWSESVSLGELKPLFLETANLFYTDYQSGVLSNYDTYPTASGIVLNTIDEAIQYSYGHENLDYGNILTMLKMIP